MAAAAASGGGRLHHTEDIAAIVVAETGLSVTEIARALGDETHPAACDARIAVVAAALGDPDAAPTGLLRAI
jgi:murein L,D-transpeptidase YcbB/YkuD